MTTRIDMIKKLRTDTGCGLGAAIKCWDESNGDYEKAYAAAKTDVAETRKLEEQLEAYAAAKRKQERNAVELLQELFNRWAGRDLTKTTPGELEELMCELDNGGKLDRALRVLNLLA